MEYKEEKRYLESVASKACEERGVYSEPIYMIMPMDENNVIDLYHWGEIEPTTINYIWLNECDKMQVASVSNGKVQYDMFAEFSNDEMKKILDVCGIEY